MNMNISIKELGLIKDAKLDLGELTLLCGANNSGKTYVTYLLYGFFKIGYQFLKIGLTDEEFETLIKDGRLEVDLKVCLGKLRDDLPEACDRYSKSAPEKVFKAVSGTLNEQLSFIVNNEFDFETILKRSFHRKVGSHSSSLFSISKESGKDIIVFELLSESGHKPPKELIKGISEDVLSFYLFRIVFPNPFISSAERTGAVIFREELDFDSNKLRNKLINKLGDTLNKSDKKQNYRDLLDFIREEDGENYAMPIQDNVEFIRTLEKALQKKSVIATEYSEILDDFSKLIGGTYTFDKAAGVMRFKATKARKALSLMASSSSIRSLLDLVIYLKHIAKKGDILMIDEPELNLHPENQRKLTRILASLINAGIHVFITTHSDYIIREFSHLIMLKQDDKPWLSHIREQYNYKDEQLLKATQVKAYITEEKKTKTVITPMEVTQEDGIEARSFNLVINEMNAIQDAIIWGE